MVGFRHTVMLALGFLPAGLTRHQFYRLYSRAHHQLKRLGVVEFPLPAEGVFYRMMQKLHRQDIIEERYEDEAYGIQLTTGGQAAFEVIVSNLQAHPEFRRIVNVFDFYRSMAAS